MEKSRSPVAAVLLSLVLPGLGQLYCGRLLWAAIFWLLHFAGWGLFLLGFAGLGWDLGLALRLAGAVFLLGWLVGMMQAGVLAHRAGSAFRMRAYNFWPFYLLIYLLAWVAPTVGLFQLVRTTLVTTYPLVSDGMAPNLLPGDFVRVDRRQSAIDHLTPGAVVALRDPADPDTVRLVRLVAVGPAEVSLGPDGLQIDGRPVERREVERAFIQHRSAEGGWEEQEVVRFSERWGEREVGLVEQPDPGARRSGRWTVPAGELFVLGDNRLGAVDSSVFGALPRSAVLGRAFQVRFSRDPRSGVWRSERRGLEVE